MSAQLGVDMPVWVGWCADHQIEGGPPELARCRKGIILDGPVPPNHSIPWVGCWSVNLTTMNVWRVKLDNGHNIIATEGILFPIDDGDESLETERERTSDLDRYDEATLIREQIEGLGVTT